MDRELHFILLTLRYHSTTMPFLEHSTLMTHFSFSVHMPCFTEIHAFLKLFWIFMSFSFLQYGLSDNQRYRCNWSAITAPQICPKTHNFANFQQNCSKISPLHLTVMLIMCIKFYCNPSKLWKNCRNNILHTNKIKKKQSLKQLGHDSGQNIFFFFF